MLALYGAGVPPSLVVTVSPANHFGPSQRPSNRSAPPEIATQPLLHPPVAPTPPRPSSVSLPSPHHGSLVSAIERILSDKVDTLILPEFSGLSGPGRVVPILTISFSASSEDYGRRESPEWFVPFNSRIRRLEAITQSFGSLAWVHMVVWADNERIRDERQTPYCNRANARSGCVPNVVVVNPTWTQAIMVQTLWASIAEGWQVFGR